MTQMEEHELLAPEQSNAKRKRSPSFEKFDAMVEEDEVFKRRRRRQSNSFQQRRRSLVTSSTSNDENGSQRFGEIYARIIKLSSENKINVKNSWSLQLIDYMHDILETSSDVSVKQQETYNFMKASCTLDASIKIYSYRVDDTWNSSYKVLENLSRNEPRKDLASDDEKKRKQERRTRNENGASSTLEKNVTNINMKQMDLDYNVDPLFHKMSKQFDEGGARGMLLANLSIYDGCKLLLNSSDVMTTSRLPAASNFSKNAISVQENEIDIATLVKDIPSDASERLLCPVIERLYVQLDQLTSIKNGSIYSPASDKENDDDIAKDSHNGSEDGCTFEGPTDVDFDLNEEMDGIEASGEVTKENFEATSTAGTPEQSAPLSAAAYFHREDQVLNQHLDDSHTFDQLLHDLSSSIHQISTEQAYSYFGSILPKKWSRRSHWKFPSRIFGKKNKVLLPDTTPNDNPQPKDDHTTAKKRGSNREKRIYTKIDFFATDKSVTHELLSYKSSKDIEFSTETIRRQIKQAEKIVLPVDAHITVQHYHQYFLKPRRSCFTFKKDQTNKRESFSEMERGQDPLFDIRTRLDSVDDHDVEFHYESDRDDVKQVPLLIADRLVPTIDINYERAAKRVNVRRLKHKIWEHLRSDGVGVRDTDTFSGTVGKENLPELSPIDERPAGTTCFRDVVKSLRSKTNSDTTMPVYFMCLLHLANEKGLKLRGQDSLQDFKIENIELSNR
uniref:Condensin complex subunit 2 n=1 Tax=Albugo laibachii Nc14 TaxID=890382 RepID=F0W2Z3_9STRA|nr:condensin complex subunit 2 putative [Albugo laibachii Nc14]|eukprot:CCA15430.1 condensin complex subunit 2 putative [Albugo laibachii Nc14]